MRPGRSIMGVIVGTLLGLGIVALAAAGASPAETPTVSSAVRSSSNVTEMVTSSMASAGAPVSFYYSAISPSSISGVPSQLDSIPKQPISLTLFAFLPILAATILGFTFYRLSKKGSAKEQPELR